MTTMKMTQLKNTLALFNTQYGKSTIIRYPFDVYTLYNGAVAIVKRDMDSYDSTYAKLAKKLNEYDSDLVVYYADSETATPTIVRKIVLEHLKNGQYYEEKIPSFKV